MRLEDRDAAASRHSCEDRTLLDRRTRRCDVRAEVGARTAEQGPCLFQVLDPRAIGLCGERRDARAWCIDRIVDLVELHLVRTHQYLQRACESDWQIAVEPAGPGSYDRLYEWRMRPGEDLAKRDSQPRRRLAVEVELDDVVSGCGSPYPIDDAWSLEIRNHQAAGLFPQKRILAREAIVVAPRPVVARNRAHFNGCTEARECIEAGDGAQA